MRCKLGFAQAEDGQLLTLLETFSPEGVSLGVSVTRFRDENLFLRDLVHGGFDGETTISLIANVLLVLSSRAERASWTSFESSEQTLWALGLQLPGEPARPSVARRAGFPSGENLRDVLLQAPMPVTMLVGPLHVVAFINPAYVRLLGRTSKEAVLGKTIREALPELEGQCFLRLLDTVYRTGEPYVGHEVCGSLRREDGTIGEFYFDFVYHPVRNVHGEVCGVLCQASNVTERVLDRQVREARELQLYRHWAELEAIYKAAPVGMSLVDSREFRYLRMNDMKAAQLGRPVNELLGRKVFELFPENTELREIYARVIAGEEVRNVRIDLLVTGAEPRCLLMNFTPVRDACGDVEAIASVAIDRTERIHPDTIIVMSFEPATTLV